MKKLKFLFEQYIMITSGIVTAMALEAILVHFLADEDLHFPWHLPISVLVGGVVGSLPTLLLWQADDTFRKLPRWRVVVHLLLTYGAVSCTGWLFSWFNDFLSFLIVSVMFFIIYALVWAGSRYLRAREVALINRALQELEKTGTDDKEEEPEQIP